MSIRRLGLFRSLRASGVASLAAGLLGLGLTGCFAVEEQPEGLVDGYSPRYTEPRGTVHPGDYLPLVAGTSVTLEGGIKGRLTVRVRGSHLGRKMDLDSAAPFDLPFATTVSVQPERPVQLAQGAVKAVPVTFAQLTLATGPGMMPSAPQSTAYFAAAEKGLYLLGVDGAGMSLSGSRATPFLKLPLTVGDSWESGLVQVPDLSVAGITGDISARARTFVVGREEVDLGGSAVPALRLEQAADFAISGASVQGVAVKVKGEMKGVTHLADGLGHVRQQVFLRAWASGSVVQNGESLTVDASLELVADVKASKAPIILKDDMIVADRASSGPLAKSGGSTGGSGGLNPMP